MKRVIRLLGSVVVYTCVSTVLAGAAILTYLANAWELDREKLEKMLAVAQGTDTATSGKPAAVVEPLPAEQASYEQILERRALAVRHLELREQAVKHDLDQVRFEHRRLADEEKQCRQLRKTFETELAAAQKNAQSEGRQEVLRTLESIKAKQAKEQLMRMLERNELDEVVSLMSAMSETKRAKIVAEFKTEIDSEKLADILRRIREAAPVTTAAGTAQKQLTRPNPAGS